MRFKKVLCMTTLATLLFPAVQNIEYVDAAEWIDDAVYSVDIVVDTVEIDINDIPEDRCVKVGISLYNSPGMNGIFFPLEKDGRLSFFGMPPVEYPNMGLSISDLTNDITEFSLYYGSLKDDLIYDGNLCYIKFSLPDNVDVGDYFSINILREYIYKSHEASNGIPVVLAFRMKEDIDIYTDYSYANFNITNGGIRIIGADSPQTEPSQTEPPQTEPPQTEPPQTELPQTELPQTELPQTSTLSDTSTPIESTTITTTSITTTNESTVTTTENTTISTTSVTTTSSASSVTTTTIPETSEVTENKNDKNKNNLPLILAVLASVGVLGGIIGFIIKKSKGHGGK